MGFGPLAKKIAEVSGYKDESTARQDLLSKPLREKIQKINNGGGSRGIEIEPGSDDYKFIADDLETIFNIIKELIIIEIPFKRTDDIPKYIPLELAVDVKDIENVEVEFISRKEVVEFLKNDIVSPYRQNYKDTHNGQSIRNTFMVATEAYYDELEIFYRKYCKRLSIQNKTFYEVDFHRIIFQITIDYFHVVIILDSESFDHDLLSFSNGLKISDIEEYIKGKPVPSGIGKEDFPPLDVEKLWIFYTCNDLTIAGGKIGKLITENKDKIVVLLIDMGIFEHSDEKSDCLKSLLWLLQSLPDRLAKMGLAGIKNPRLSGTLDKKFKVFFQEQFENKDAISVFLLAQYRWLKVYPMLEPSIKVTSGRLV